MSDAQAPPSRTSITSNDRPSPSTLRIPLHQSRPDPNQRPSLEALEDDRTFVRQVERSQRDTETIDVDATSTTNNESDGDSVDSIALIFAQSARRFRRPNYVSPPPSSTRAVNTLIEQANEEGRGFLIGIVAV